MFIKFWKKNCHICNEVPCCSQVKVYLCQKKVSVANKHCRFWTAICKTLILLTYAEFEYLGNWYYRTVNTKTKISKQNTHALIHSWRNLSAFKIPLLLNAFSYDTTSETHFSHSEHGFPITVTRVHPRPLEVRW